MNLQIDLPEQVATKLVAAAERLRVSPEELLTISVEEKLAQLDQEFDAASEYVLTKNDELYRRLA